MIKKYKTKPVEKFAVQWDGSTDSAKEIESWSNGIAEACYNAQGFLSHMRIRTLEGEMNAEGGDYVIKGLRGEFYFCKPDIFAATYEPA